MKSPKVDIIIPAYNQGHYLKECVESALAQTWENIEVIIVDDGSTDNTAEVGQSFDDPRVTYIYQDNKGLSGARNTGLENSTGEFVSFLDSDDLFLPTKLSKLMGLFADNPELGLCAGDSILIGEDGEPIGKTYGDGMPNRPEEWLNGNRIHVGSVLVKKEWLDKVDPFDENLRACEDWDMWLRLAIMGCQMKWLPETVSKYRVHSHQMTRETLRMKSAMLTVLDKTFENENLPDSWKNFEAEARSSALVKAAARAFLSGDGSSAEQDIQAAVQANPTLAQNNGEHLLQTLLGWAFSPSSDDPLRYMTSVFAHLPKNVQVTDTQRKELLGQLAVNLAFETYAQGQSNKSRQYIVETAKIAPGRLVNRKLCGIFLKSLLAG